jgi:hypothetical protein
MKLPAFGSAVAVMALVLRGLVAAAAAQLIAGVAVMKLKLVAVPALAAAAVAVVVGPVVAGPMAGEALVFSLVVETAAWTTWPAAVVW